MRVVLAAVALLICVGCGGADVSLDVTTTAAPYAQAADLAPRLGRVLSMSAEHWQYLGGFAELRIVFQGGPIDCSGTPHLGCYHHGLDGTHTIWVSTDGSNCVERSPLPHEILHYVLDRETGNPDATHSDPRWAELDAVLYPALAAGGKLFCTAP